MHRLQDLVRLHRMGTPAREVARLLRMGVEREREFRGVLKEAALLAGPVDDLPSMEALREAVLKARPEPLVAVPAHEVSSVEGWREQVKALMKKGLRPRAIYDRLRGDDPEVERKYYAIKRLCRAILRERGVRPDDIAIPVETQAGEIAQVDFGYVGRFLDPRTRTMRRTWVFVMVLGFSRHMVAYLVFDQKTETWLDLHRRAFEELGGVVETVVPDNLKAAVLRAAFGVDRDNELNRSYREQARHYGFQVDPAPPRQARKKGKVESAVKYVKHNGLAGLEGCIDEARQHLVRWLHDVAGQRVHGTTRQKPAEVFRDVEASALKPLPAVAYAPIVWKKATVHPDTHVFFDGRLYSVPWKLTGQQVWVKATRAVVSAYANDELVASHDRNSSGYRSTKEEHLPEGRRDLRHRSRGYWEQRAANIGNEVAAYIREVFEADDVLSQLRTVQGIVTHLEAFPKNRARAACARARHYGNYRYTDIKHILKRALDLEPLPEASPAAALTTPRFARSIQELLPLEEVS